MGDGLILPSAVACGRTSAEPYARCSGILFGPNINAVYNDMVLRAVLGKPYAIRLPAATRAASDEVLTDRAATGLDHRRDRVPAPVHRGQEDAVEDVWNWRNGVATLRR